MIGSRCRRPRALITASSAAATVPWVPELSDAERQRRERDRGLLAGCRRGDAQAWADLLRAYERLVFSIPRSYGLDVDDASDVAQQTFAALLTGLDSLTDDERVLSWLGTVARRQTWRLIERSRRDRAHVSSLDAAGASGDPVPDPADPSDPYELFTRRAWLGDGLLALDERCRTLLTALYLEAGEPSYVEIGRRMDLAVGSIGPTRARCLGRLRALLEPAQPPVYRSGTGPALVGRSEEER